MSSRIKRLLPEKSFLHKLSMLAGGTLAGQGMLILVAPLLTRLFTPEEFGFFGVFAALTAMVGVGSALRFEFAIATVHSDAEAAALVKVAVFSSAGMALLLCLLVWLFGGHLAARLEATAFAMWLWLLPLAIFCLGLSATMAYWSIRNGSIGVNAISRALKFSSQGSSQVLLGWLSGGALALILGYITGFIVSFIYYVSRLSPSDLKLIRAQSIARAWQAARDNRRYPIFSLPTGFLESASQHLPVLLLALLFGPAGAGFYSLSQRIIGMPVRMLSDAASQVFHSELRSKSPAELQRAFLRTLLFFGTIGVIGMVPLACLAPSLFAVVFGEPWREAGVIVQLLVPLYLARFIVLPISQLLYLLGRQEIHLITAVLNISGLGIGFTVGYLHAWTMFQTIFLFSLLSACSFAVYLFMTWIIVRRATRLQVPPIAEE